MASPRKEVRGEIENVSRMPRPLYVPPIIEEPHRYGFIDSEEHNTCPYGWLFSVGACATSLCTLVVLITFFIWMATKGISLN